MTGNDWMVGGSEMSKVISWQSSVGWVPGPLLYHYCDVPGESSVEISYNDLRCIIKKFGFTIEVSISWTFACSGQLILAFLRCL